MGFYGTSVHIEDKLGQENILRIVKWMRWHCTKSSDTVFKIRALAFWGRARNKMIDLYVLLAMPFNSFLVVVIYIIEIPSFYFGNAT